MIIDALLAVVFAVATWLVSLFPESTLSISLGSASGYLGWVGEVVNLSALSAAVSVIVAGETALFVVRGALFVWHQVH